MKIEPLGASGVGFRRLYRQDQALNPRYHLIRVSIKLHFSELPTLNAQQQVISHSITDHQYTKQIHKRTFGLKIYRDEAFRIALGTCCMSLAVANKLNCTCDELITIISLVDRIQGRAGRRLQTDSQGSGKGSEKKKSSQSQSISKEALKGVPFKQIV